MNDNDWEYFVEWKLIVINGIITNYLVSSEGEVKNRMTGKILKPYLNSNGYCQVGIYINGKFKNSLLHRLVASAFIPNIENKLEVNHIDGNKLNNRVENLEWCNRSENQLHAFANGLNHANVKYGSTNGNSIYEESTIHLVCKLLTRKVPNKIIEFLTNVDQRYVSKIKKKKVWEHVSDLYEFDLNHQYKTISFKKFKKLLKEFNIELNSEIIKEFDNLIKY